jgi:hypothetical protein
VHKAQVNIITMHFNYKKKKLSPFSQREPAEYMENIDCVRSDLHIYFVSKVTFKKERFPDCQREKIENEIL